MMTSSFEKIRHNKRDNFFKVKDTLQRERYLIWCLSYFCNTPWLWDIGRRLLHTVAGIEDWNRFSKSATKGCSFGFFYLLLGLVKGCILCDNIKNIKCPFFFYTKAISQPKRNKKVTDKRNAGPPLSFYMLLLLNNFPWHASMCHVCTRQYVHICV